MSIMEWKRLRQWTRGRWWLIVGMALYLVAALSSIVRSLSNTGFGDNLYMAVDWLTACIIYFFLGGLFGFGVDWLLSRRRPLSVPLWFWLTIALWAGGALIVAVTNEKELSTALILFFPWVFGIFFTGFAFVLLTPKWIEQSYAGKLVFDLLYLGVFLWWLYLANNPRARRLRLVLLWILFGILFLGLTGCAHALAR